LIIRGGPHPPPPKDGGAGNVFVRGGRRAGGVARDFASGVNYGASDPRKEGRQANRSA